MTKPNMTKPKKILGAEKVPKNMKDTFDSLTKLTDEFSKKYLNNEYCTLIRKLIGALCRKRPSPLLQGNIRTWAAGVIHALGMVNFLFDPSQNPHVSSKDISNYFCLGQSTVNGKSKQIRDTMKLSQWDFKWMLPSNVEDNSLVWMISVNGLILDSRDLPRGIQEEALKKGLIPFLPQQKEC